MTAPTAQDEIARGDRFAFGSNWDRFLQTLDETRILEAEASLQRMLGISTLDGRTFLDIGCGSGLFSLVARRLGATVTSFDFDPQSVACAEVLRARYFPQDTGWKIQQGSVLDRGFIEQVGHFDVVYSWGVLHHTGAMWEAVAQAMRCVRPAGLFWVALYNRQPILTGYWKFVKRVYLGLPAALRPLWVVPYFVYAATAGLIMDLARLRDPRVRYRGTGRRGMRAWYDAVDWVGGWPFEVASPEEVLAFGEGHGFTLVTERTVGRRHGCNEFVFRRRPEPD